MKILILGGTGMLGHKLWQVYSAAPEFQAFATLRGAPMSYERFGIYNAERMVGGVTAENFASIRCAIDEVQPAVVINCIGVVKQLEAAKDSVASISLNALLPHRLAQICQSRSIRLIHISTDCVFTGRKGGYTEAETPDATDLYGRTKLLGEVTLDNSLTLRTSIIGRELAGAHGLVEWFLSQRDKASVRGFRRAIFSGWTTLELANVIRRIITEQTNMSGLWHVAAEPINKYDLLSLIKEIYKLKVEIESDEEFTCDRSLDGARFRAATGIVAPAWRTMIEAMHNDSTSYEEIRNAKK